MAKFSLFFLILFFTVFGASYGQNGLALETSEKTITFKEYSPCLFITITGSYYNLKELLFCNMDSYKATMEKYNYSLTTDHSGYMAKTICRGQDYYLISKSTGEISMIYSDDNDITSLRDEIKRLYPNIRAHFVDGFEIYATPLKQNGIIYKLQVYIQEKQSGGGLIVMRQF